MKILKVPYTMLGILVMIFSCKKQQDLKESSDPNKVSIKTEATVSATAPPLVAFPVRGPHNTGYDATAGQYWTCYNAYSNSDFNPDPDSKYYHPGVDIWAPLGTPVVATVAGKIVQAEWSDYSGWLITISTSAGWSHFYCHLNSYAPGVYSGATVTAGQIIGTVGNTGSSAKGVVHLHYTLHPNGNYWAAIDPWPYLKAVESNVCVPQSGKAYRIIAKHSGKTVVVTNASTADGANVIQWDYSYATPNNDQWYFTHLGNGYYKIINRHSGKALVVTNASTADGAKIIQWSYSTATPHNDQWSVEPTGGGYYKIKNRHSAKKLNVAGSSTANGAQIIQYHDFGLPDNMRFQLIEI